MVSLYHIKKKTIAMGKLEQPPTGASSTSPQETAAERMAMALAYIQEEERAIVARIDGAESKDAAHRFFGHVRIKKIPGFREISRNKQEKAEIESVINAANELIDETLEVKLESFRKVEIDKLSPVVRSEDREKDGSGSTASERKENPEVLSDLLGRSGFIDAIGFTGEVGDDHGEIVAALREQYIDWLKREDGSVSWTPEQVFAFLEAEEEKNPSQITLEPDHSTQGGEHLPEKQTAQAGEATEEAAPIPDAPEKAPEAVVDDQEGAASALLVDEDSAGSVADIDPSAQPTEDVSRPDSPKPISESEDISIADEIREGIAKVRKTIDGMERNGKLPPETIATLRRSLSEKEDRVGALLKGMPEDGVVSQELADILSDIPDVSVASVESSAKRVVEEAGNDSDKSDTEGREKKELQVMREERRDRLVAGANALVDHILTLVETQGGGNEAMSDDEMAALEKQVLLPALEVYWNEAGGAASKGARSRETVRRKMLGYFRSRIGRLKTVLKSSGNAA